ncbi:hypothetical protein DOTSEDRAFT_70306 [Dothistroma septosporum NZE10]|uniref:Uncharacterized protein n=1 Tax=Dothistroma septosporum (strain NZE10 / CBS 128990) TaxID=675120 RepID=N1PSA5_DOTSN|nr:hypothetical protein DOTSEDRAFT_70306 [Dothistroma septosporum NZE10]
MAVLNPPNAAWYLAGEHVQESWLAGRTRTLRLSQAGTANGDAANSAWSYLSKMVPAWHTRS